MVTVYDNLMQLPGDASEGETTQLIAAHAGRIMLRLDSDDFRVEYKDGKASVALSRHLTNEQARELGQRLIDCSNAIEERDRSWTTVDEYRTVEEVNSKL